ncbi:hypothetical protein B0H13DRAFT_2271781, partial [Mycena leptocephala]
MQLRRHENGDYLKMKTVPRLSRPVQAKAQPTPLQISPPFSSIKYAHDKTNSALSVLTRTTKVAAQKTEPNNPNETQSHAGAPEQGAPHGKRQDKPPRRQERPTARLPRNDSDDEHGYVLPFFPETTPDPSASSPPPESINEEDDDNMTDVDMQAPPQPQQPPPRQPPPPQDQQQLDQQARQQALLLQQQQQQQQPFVPMTERELVDFVPASRLHCPHRKKVPAGPAPHRPHPTARLGPATHGPDPVPLAPNSILIQNIAPTQLAAFEAAPGPSSLSPPKTAAISDKYDGPVSLLATVSSRAEADALVAYNGYGCNTALGFFVKDYEANKAVQTHTASQYTVGIKGGDPEDIRKWAAQLWSRPSSTT